MTSCIAGSSDMLFLSKNDVYAFIKSNLLNNKGYGLGTEWEVFFNTEDGAPIDISTAKKALDLYKNAFVSAGFNASFLTEINTNGEIKRTGVSVDNLGTITLEIGLQFEFSSTLCSTTKDVIQKNSVFFSITQTIAHQLGLIAAFSGHNSKHLRLLTEPARSRIDQWQAYYKTRFGRNALRASAGLGTTASTQITIDSGAEKFHEYMRALLIIEPCLALHYNQSNRLNVSAYSLPAAHMAPIIGVWSAKTNDEAIHAYVDRLMKVEVPFLPDPEYPALYKAERLLRGAPPTIQGLLDQGRLSERNLLSASSFLFSRPALRNLSKGLIEIRGVDSLPNPKAIGGYARRIMSLIYNDSTREALLDDYAHLTTHDVLTLHQAASASDKHEALHTLAAGEYVQNYVEDILDRADTSSTTTGEDSKHITTFAA